MKETRARSIPLVAAVEKKKKKKGKEEEEEERRRRDEKKNRSRKGKKKKERKRRKKLIRQLNRDVYHPFPVKFQKFVETRSSEIGVEQEILNV